jgi:hypothetical protein
MAVARLLAAACIAGALAASYPAIREEMAERGFLAEARRFGTPVIAVDCERSRGVENRDFTREDKNPDKCWMALTSFRRLYPEIAETIDARASARFLDSAGLPAESRTAPPRSF